MFFVFQKLFSMHVPSPGHGEHGDVVSHFVMHELESVLAAHPSLLDDPAKALTESYVKVDESLAATKVRQCLSYVQLRPGATVSCEAALPALAWDCFRGTYRKRVPSGMRACHHVRRDRVK